MVQSIVYADNMEPPLTFTITPWMSHVMCFGTNKAANLASASPHRQMSYTILCFLVGGRATFAVDIEQTKLVGHLKEEIKKKIPNQLNHIDPEHLTLYQVEVDASHKPTYLRQLDEKTKTLDPLSELNDAEKLSSVFPEGPLEMKIQILVQPPEGESTYCGGVVLLCATNIALWLMLLVPQTRKLVPLIRVHTQSNHPRPQPNWRTTCSRSLCSFLKVSPPKLQQISPLWLMFLTPERTLVPLILQYPRPRI